MQFEWDTKKAVINKRKHRVSFETAVRVFLDPARQEIYDKGHDAEEDRWKVIGLVAPEILVVIYTERGRNGGVTRIISARKADEKEKQSYYAVCV
ncbi:MAG: BrnT family toxin [Desulfovibrio sp.]|jgi:uncharacterized DUF497 family protein|nr:BrnT family toxin [Desulfovibrio sp.]